MFALVALEFIGYGFQEGTGKGVEGPSKRKLNMEDPSGPECLGASIQVWVSQRENPKMVY